LSDLAHAGEISDQVKRQVEQAHHQYSHESIFMKSAIQPMHALTVLNHFPDDFSPKIFPDDI
jgi:hypothetical protein